MGLTVVFARLNETTPERQMTAPTSARLADERKLAGNLTLIIQGLVLLFVGAVMVAVAVLMALNLDVREIGVGATRAAGRAVEALFDTAQERVVIDTCRLRMRLEYFFNRHGSLLSRSDHEPDLEITPVGVRPLKDLA